MSNTYLSLQGTVYIDNVDIGNVPVFKINDRKFAIQVENFTKENLHHIFESTEAEQLKLNPPDTAGFSTRELRFEGINTADSNEQMIFETLICIEDFEALDLINKEVTSLTLFGTVHADIQLTYKKAKVREPIKYKHPVKAEKIVDLVKINDDLFHVISSDILLSRRNIESIYSNPVNKKTSFIYSVCGQSKRDPN